MAGPADCWPCHLGPDHTGACEFRPLQRKPGRPPIHDDDKRREQRIFSRNEWAHVKAQATQEGMTAAAWVRARCGL